MDGKRALSFGRKLTLINACLSSIPTYRMLMYLLPKTILKRMDRTRKRFSWQGGGKRKYHLVKWTKITKLENKGGLGVKDLRKMNISMLCRWWWKLEMRERLWQDVVRKKYVTENGITQLKSRPTNSPIWNDLLKIIEYLLKRQNSIDWRWKI
jgi:hypothetical protein